MAFLQTGLTALGERNEKEVKKCRRNQRDMRVRRKKATPLRNTTPTNHRREHRKRRAKDGGRKDSTTTLMRRSVRLTVGNAEGLSSGTGLKRRGGEGTLLDHSCRTVDQKFAIA